MGRLRWTTNDLDHFSHILQEMPSEMNVSHKDLKAFLPHLSLVVNMENLKFNDYVLPLRVFLGETWDKLLCARSSFRFLPY